MSTTTIPGTVPSVYPSNPSGSCPTNNCPTGGTSSGSGSSGSNPMGAYPNVTSPNTGEPENCDCPCVCPDNNNGGSGSSGTNPSGTHPNVTSPNTGETENCPCSDDNDCLTPAVDEDNIHRETENTGKSDGEYKNPVNTDKCISNCSTEILPGLFSTLIEDNYLSCSQIDTTSDKFFMSRQSLSHILKAAGIHELEDDGPLDCDQYFDDWYLYVIKDGDKEVCSLVKMREQETDGSNATNDGDNNDPGVTISFIPFDISILQNCLDNDSTANRKALYNEINRVVFLKGQTYDTTLQKYFSDPASEAAYNIAELYVQHIVDSSNDNCILLPEIYKNLLQKSKKGRIEKFIESINEKAGYIVCDNEKIIINSKAHLTDFEKYAILATHTGNVSFNSFAAEVQFHADALDSWYGCINLFNSHEMAIRADMAIGEEKESGYTDKYYDLDSDIVKKQIEHHGER